jgi:hypothetical protein
MRTPNDVLFPLAFFALIGWLWYAFGPLAVAFFALGAATLALAWGFVVRWLDRRDRAKSQAYNVQKQAQK